MTGSLVSSRRRKSSAAPKTLPVPRDAIDTGQAIPGRPVDMDDNNNPEDDTGMSDTCSNFSTVSEDSLPPIHAYSHTYHGSGQLMTPNDESEARRMALQHKLFSLCLDGGLIDAKLPLENHTPENPLQILDIGSGSGIWACEMGQLHPQVNILGIDITRALLPTNVPTNVTFEIADVMDPWPPQTYDFIHMRNLVGGGIRDWQGLIDRAFAHLKPGGMLEFTENRPRFFDVDPEHADLPGLPAGARPDVGAACREFQAAFGAMCEKQGLNSDPIPDVPGFLSELGAESIRERSDWLPVKVWGNDPIMRKKGEILGEMLNYSFENASLMLFGKCGWEEKDTRALLDRVLKEVQDPNLRSTVQVTFITARKPLVPSKPEADGPETTDTNTEQVD